MMGRGDPKLACFFVFHSSLGILDLQFNDKLVLEGWEKQQYLEF